MKCKHCSKEIYLRSGNGSWIHCEGQAGWPSWGNEHCDNRVAEPEQTEAQRDLEFIRSAVRRGDSGVYPSFPIALALYQTVIRLAEKVGLE